MTIILLLGYLIGLIFIFYLLAKICDEYFVESLNRLSRKLKLSEDVAGATLMAMGSSAPEFFTSFISIMSNQDQIGSGTIVGSAIFNILIIVGLSAVVATTFLHWKPVIRDLGFYMFSILLLLITFQDGKITFAESVFYVILFLVYLWMLIRWKQWFPRSKIARELEDVEETIEKEEERLKHKKNTLGYLLSIVDGILDKTLPDLKKHPKRYPVVFVLSIAYIGLLSWALVNIASGIAEILNIPAVIVSLTVIAIGTSIPDLLSSLIVAQKGRGDMAVSNAVGSNTFNILVCLGFSWFIFTLLTGQHVVVGTENLFSSVLLLLFSVLALLFLLVLQNFKIGRKAGFLLILLYFLYLAYAIYGASHPDIMQIQHLFKGVLG